VSSSPTETSVEVAMPQMGVSVTEGTVVEWRKRPGDWIAADEPICDVTTDKVDVEIPAPASGRLARVLVEPGATVAVGAVLAEIDVAARPGEAHPDEHDGGAKTVDQPDRSAFYSPVVRRIADKHGVDLSKVTGTGVGGRVRKRDVLDHVSEGPPGQRVPALHAESLDEGTPAPHDADALFGPTRREPMSPMRQTIARHMTDSRRAAAHCTTVVEVDLSRVAIARGGMRDAMRRRGVKLTYLAFVAVAVAEALQEHPRLNASVQDSDIVFHEDVNLGIAVALEDGLIVPVIRRAQRLNLEGMAAAIGDLAARARDQRLAPDEVHGGTFTITNPGQFGAVLATPIINQPQVAILDLEAVVKRAVVVEGPEGEAIAIRPMTHLCMSWDHRALDGADAARFLGFVKGRLEEWKAR
jgi:pyruvate/2-oxoglutarate dehydrogenase complex dihydrolipoamide acyltransferase (E2) component